MLLTKDPTQRKCRLESGSGSKEPEIICHVVKWNDGAVQRFKMETYNSFKLNVGKYN